MSEWKQKRFWSDVAVSENADGFEVRLDGRPLKTPAKAALMVPTVPLAQAIADEWAAQEGYIDPLSMPFTRTANAAIDKVAPQKCEVAELLAEYGATDLLCYRATEPEALVIRQAAAWDPLLEWADRVLGARLKAVPGVIHVAQDDEALGRLTGLVRSQNSFELAAFHDLVSLSGSLIIGFAAVRHQSRPEALWDVSRIDEDWQIEQWGEDEEAAAMALTKRTAFLHASRFFDLVQNQT